MERFSDRGSIPLASTRLSLDAIRVLGSSFYLPCRSRMMGIFFVNTFL